MALINPKVEMGRLQKLTIRTNVTIGTDSLFAAGIAGHTLNGQRDSLADWLSSCTRHGCDPESWHGQLRLAKAQQAWLSSESLRTHWADRGQISQRSLGDYAHALYSIRSHSPAITPFTMTPVRLPRERVSASIQMQLPRHTRYVGGLGRIGNRNGQKFQVVGVPRGAASKAFRLK